MRFSKRQKSKVDFLFLLALFGVFVISALFIVLFGARIYKNTVNEMDSNFASRTTVAYVTEKIRSHEKADCITFHKQGELLEQSDVLALYEESNGNLFVTYLYCEDGYLKELTQNANSALLPNAGSNILELKEFHINQISPALYEFTIVDNNSITTTFFVSTNVRQTGGLAYEQ